MWNDDKDKTTMHSISALSAAATPEAQTPCLIVVSARSSVGRMYKLGGEMTIGRSPDVDIVLEDDGVSRRHAKVAVSLDGAAQLMDMGSTNGTFHNGERIDVRQLREGDKIQVGAAILKFTYQDQLDEALQQNLYESAVRDGLTRLYNRKYFADAIVKEFAYSQRHGVPLSLVMFDVDHFKRINDGYGHPAGDYVLQLLAQKVTECIRVEDTLARYGGEEFALLLREASEDKAFVCAERIRRAVEATPFVFNQTRIPVTISLGLATHFGNNMADPAALIAEADRYLYRAKQNGRNRVEAAMLSGP